MDAWTQTQIRRADDAQTHRRLDAQTLRRVCALIVSVAAGFLIGCATGLNSCEISFSKLPALFVISLVAGTITPLISWKHTPGLPGMAFALTIAALGFCKGAPPLVDQYDSWVLKIVQGLALLTGFLLTYSLAFLTDTRIVFRKLTVRPEPKKIGPRITLTRLLPGCILTAAVASALGRFIPLPPAVSVSFSFAIGALGSSILFRHKSTLWYALSAPLSLCFAGLLAVSQYHNAVSIIPLSWQQLSAFAFCGFGAAGAIPGHWLQRLSAVPPHLDTAKIPQ